MKKHSSKDFIVMLAVMAILIPFLIYAFTLSRSVNQSGAGSDSEAVSYPVRINEILSSNSLYPDSNGVCCDWIELYNDSDSAVDISGFALSDNLVTVRHTFPAGTVIGPRSYMVVYCSNEIESDTYAKFNISKSGEEDILLISASNVTINHIKTIPATANRPIVMNGAGEWVLADYATPGYSNDESGREAYIASLGLVSAELRITEIMSTNISAIADCDGDFSDYFEITNFSDHEVSLGGYYVSDDQNDLLQYRLPDVTVQPGGTVTVFASGKNKVTETGEIHAVFSLASDGETVCLSSPIGTLIDSAGYTALPDNHAMIVRQTGESEISSSPSPGYPNTDEGYEAFCASRVSAGAISISEVMTSNFSYMAQRDGEYYDWVEIKNTSGSAVNLADYYMTDSLSIKNKFRLPAISLASGEYCVIICSGNTSLTSEKYTHANFTLSAEEDSLYIYDRNAQLVDYATLVNLTYGGSYGRMDGASGYFYFAKPTPGAVNGEGKRTITPTPFTKTSAGVYNDAESLTIELGGGDNIRYTTDGSLPSASSKQYTEPITITKTTVIRAACFSDSALTGETATFSYFLREGHTLPIVSLAADPDDLWSDERGIYVEGNHSNYEKDWERPANVSLFESDGSFSIDCGLGLHGAGTRVTCPKKSFKLQFRGQYDGSLRYQVFDDSPISEFSTLILRGGEDYSRTLFRDELSRTLADEGSEHLLTLNDKYCVLYINGDYFGIYAIREDYSRDYCADHMNVSPDSVTVVHGPVYKKVAPELYGLIDYARDKDMRIEDNYRYMESKINMDSLIDWYIYEAYCGNNDIPGNVRYVYSTEEGKWRMCFFDMDWGFVWRGTCKWIFDEERQHSALFHSLIKNEQFKDRFLTRAAELFNGALSNDSVLKTIDYYEELLRPEMERERARWGRSVADWEKSIEDVRGYITKQDRVGQLLKSMKEYMPLSDKDISRYFGR